MFEGGLSSQRMLHIQWSVDNIPSYLVCVEGEEGLSELFHYQLTIHTEKPLPMEQLIAQPVSFCMKSNDKTRYFNGWIASITENQKRANEQQEYCVDVVPWLWFLDKNADCRVFQNKTTPEIVTGLLKEFGYSNFDVSGLHANYERRDYCVQYNESTWHFLSRLLEDAGIYYYFDYAQGQHTLMLVDDVNGCKQFSTPVIYANHSADSVDHVYRWSKETRYVAKTITRSDYDFQSPATSLLVSRHNPTYIAPRVALASEHYLYPGHYRSVSAGIRKTNLLCETSQASSVDIVGASHYQAFQAGTVFSLTQHSNQKELGCYVVTKVKHKIHDYSHSNTNAKPAMYHNEFHCQPVEMPYRPPLRHKKPKIFGRQSAIVTGPDNEKIYTDKYGRIKVQFPWDRYGKHNQHSSCWIRTVQYWAGDRFGAQFIPRIGQEVNVEFLNGDPDYPIVTGTLNNAINRPFYPLPEKKYVSGIRSHSLGDVEKIQGNEICFNDKAGHEKLLFKAQKDLHRQVNQDDYALIDHNDEMTIEQGSQMIQVKGHQRLKAKQSIELRSLDSYIKLEPNQLTLSGPQIRINCDPPHAPKKGESISHTLEELNDIRGVMFGVTEDSGGVPEDKTGVGEVIQIDGTRRIVKAVEDLRTLNTSEKMDC